MGGFREEGYFFKIRVFFSWLFCLGRDFFWHVQVFTNVADAVTNTAILARPGALLHLTVFGRCTFLYRQQLRFEQGRACAVFIDA